MTSGVAGTPSSSGLVFIGENPAMSLFHPTVDRPAVVASWWRTLWSPHGPGDSVIVWSDDAGVPSGTWTSSPPLARWLNRTFVAYFEEFEDVAVADLDVFDAEIAGLMTGSSGRVGWNHAGKTIALAWADVLDRRIVQVDDLRGSGFDLSTIIAPVADAWIEVDGDRHPAQPRQNRDGGITRSSAFLTYAELWRRTSAGSDPGAGARPPATDADL
jgi:hypothetical protein